jgi:hypothetical protein
MWLTLFWNILKLHGLHALIFPSVLALALRFRKRIRCAVAYWKWEGKKFYTLFIRISSFNWTFKAAKVPKAYREGSLPLAPTGGHLLADTLSRDTKSQQVSFRSFTWERVECERAIIARGQLSFARDSWIAACVDMTLLNHENKIRLTSS